MATREEQQKAFLNGKQMNPKDASYGVFLGGPKEDSSAGVFKGLPKEDKSAKVFKVGPKLDPSAKDFIGDFNE
jgi:hypothetical protein